MRVLMTADTVGGVWTYALELIDALAPHGVDVELATMGARLRPDQRRELARSAVAGVHESSYRLEWMDDPWRDVEAAGRWLLELRDQVQPDVVHLNGFAHGALEWDAPVVVAGHSCVLSWFAAVRRADAPPTWDRYARAVERGLAGADVLVAPTAALLETLVRLYRPDCVRLAIPNARRATAERREKEPFVFAAGRLWDEAKNVAALDRVAPRLAWPVLVCGDAGGLATANARLLGRIDADEVADLMARAAIFALPARYEPFGLAALEAAHAGCALVLGDIPTLREVWDDAALFVPPDDDDALAQTLEVLIADARLREEFASRAVDQAASYTPARMAAGYLDAYALAGAPLRAAV